MSSKNLLFLDCDGVLNTFEWIYALDVSDDWYEYTKQHIDPEKLNIYTI